MATTSRTTRRTSPAIAFKPRVRPISDHRYLVESKTHRGVGHQVDTLRGTCSCPAGKKGMRRCWHRTLAATIDPYYTAWITRPGAGMAALLEAF